MKKRRKIREISMKTADERRKSGFTLIELLMDVTIMLIVAGMIVGVAALAKRNARVARAKSALEQIHDALINYKLDTSVYPDTLNAILDRLPKSIAINTNVSPRVPMDGWGRDFVYELQNEEAYTLYSQGPKEGIDADDIYSGK